MPSGGALAREGAGGTSTGRGNCSHAISCPFGAHDESARVTNDRFSQYSVPGSGVIAGIGSATSRCSPGGMSGKSTVPWCRALPLALTLHDSDAASRAFRKSNQLRTAIRPDLGSTALPCRER